MVFGFWNLRLEQKTRDWKHSVRIFRDRNLIFFHSMRVAIHAKNGIWIIIGDIWIITLGTGKIKVWTEIFATDTVKITVHTVKCTGAQSKFSSATSNSSNAVFCVYNSEFYYLYFPPSEVPPTTRAVGEFHVREVVRCTVHSSYQRIVYRAGSNSRYFPRIGKKRNKNLILNYVT